MVPTEFLWYLGRINEDVGLDVWTCCTGSSPKTI